MKSIYLDHNATTPLDRPIVQAIEDFLVTSLGNPSSTHGQGQQARGQLTEARRLIAKSLGVLPQEVVFTSGATEGMNFLLNGLTGHIITSNVEHACTEAALKRLAADVDYLPAGLFGAITAEQVAKALRPETRAIVLMAVNNETGVITPLPEIAEIAEKAGIPLIVDAVAWLGKAPFHIPRGVTALAISGHKLHAPSGIGAVFIRKGFKPKPLIVGGPQELGWRGGTENMLGIVALAAAMKAIDPSQFQHMTLLRDQLEQGILALYPGALINGQGPRISNTLNVAFPDKDGETLLMSLDQAGLAVSLGSACSSGALEPSRVLLAMGFPTVLAKASLRFSLSRMTTSEEIQAALAILKSVLR